MRSMIRIGERGLGPGNPAYVIAGIACGPCADLERLKELVRAAKYAGAAAFRLKSAGPGLDGAVDESGACGWDFSPDVEPELLASLLEYSRSIGITMIAELSAGWKTAFIEGLGADAFLATEGTLTREALISTAASLGKPIVISVTDLAFITQVREAIELISRKGNFEAAILYGCQYPVAYDEANLGALAILKREFRCPVGFSDNMPGGTIAAGAVALGASMIEKGITVSGSADYDAEGALALDVEDFRAFVAGIRNMERALGDGVKKSPLFKTMDRAAARRILYGARPNRLAQDNNAGLKLIRTAGFNRGVFTGIGSRAELRVLNPSSANNDEL